MNSSAVEERKVLNEYVVGVMIGSMLSVERRRSGVEDEMRVGMQACNNVAGRMFEDTDIEGRSERQGYMERGAEEMGVTIRRVRMRSRGARIMAAIAVAATATPRDMRGEGLSIMSRPPIPLAVAPTVPGSGMLRRAEMALRNQLSVVLRRKLYINVQLVPFHTPHADSFCHS